MQVCIEDTQDYGNTGCGVFKRNNEILVVFQCEKWFVYQTTWFKARLLRLEGSRNVKLTVKPNREWYTMYFYNLGN